MKQNFFQKFNQLKRYVKQLNKLIKTGRFNTLTTKKRNQIIKRIERLQRQLALTSGQQQVKRLLVASSFALGLAITPVAAQNIQYKAKQANPFSLSPAGTEYIMPTMGDIDGDGDMDMIVAEYYGTFSYYENDGTGLTPNFKPGVTSPFSLPAGTGYFRAPTLVDIDGDGDLDIMSAEYYGIFYYQNTGTVTAPVFAAPVLNSFGFQSNYTTTVKFADLDSDGDLDALTLSVNVGLNYYENTGSSTNPVFGSAQNNPFGFQLGIYSLFLEVGDIDNDGDVDLLIGEYNYGDLRYYENTGTSVTPAFSSGVINSLGMDMTGTDTYFNVPTLVDIDKDGDLDLFCGEYSVASASGNIINYQECNTAPMSNDTVVATVKNVDYQFLGSEFDFSDIDNVAISAVKISTLPAKGTLNLSGNLVTAGDMIPFADITNLTFSPEMDSIGMAYTSFEFQVMDDVMASIDTNTVTIDVNIPVGTAALMDDVKMTLAPNPATNYLRIEIEGIEPQASVNLSVLDVSGRIVYREIVESSELYNKTIPTNRLANGVYFITIETTQGIIRERFVKK